MQRPWRQRFIYIIPLFSVLAFGSIAKAEPSQKTQIVSINGVYDLSQHKQVLFVHPGDSISLSADLVGSDDTGAPAAASAYAEDFTWMSDAVLVATPEKQLQDVCNLQNSCEQSNFEPNSWGVSFNVPWNIEKSITINVVNIHSGSWDQVTLVNDDYNQNAGYTPPTSSYSDPEDYPENSAFNYDTALAGHGRWIYASGERWFVPYSYQNDWVPYQNGQWVWTSAGFTWESYDPWGWITDHYGYWRHHSSYGWIWSPFNDYTWHPAVVTWFHTPDGIGWNPYYDGYADGYRRGESDGFNDGFWLGYQAGLNASSGYHCGWTYVGSNNFYGRNIYEVRVVNVSIQRYYAEAYGRGNYGRSLRDNRYSDPREFVGNRMGRAIPVTESREVSRRTRDGKVVRWVQPATRAEVPEYYRGAARQSSERVRTGARVPVGSVTRPEDGGRVTRPSSPVVTPPRRRLPDGKTGPVVPVRTKPPEQRRPSPTPEPERRRPEPTPEPRRPSPTPEPRRPDPTPAPERRRPEPTPEPRRPSPTPEPERRRPEPTPEPRRPSPTPEPRRPDPTPAPERRRPEPTPEPRRPSPTPEPRKPEPRRPEPTQPTTPSGPHRPGGGRRP